MENSKKVPIGLVQGRFQMIHKGHLEYFLAAKKKCDFLLIGISDHDPERSYFDYTPHKNGYPQKPYRTLVEPNHTFTYFERMMMIRESLLDAGLSHEDFEVIPFPVHHTHLIKYYIPSEAVIFVTIYADWGKEKLALFQSMGYQTDMLWQRTMEERFTTGTEVRRRIANGEEWESLVPKGVARVIKRFKLDEELRKLAK